MGKRETDKMKSSPLSFILSSKRAAALLFNTQRRNRDCDSLAQKDTMTLYKDTCISSAMEALGHKTYGNVCISPAQGSWVSPTVYRKTSTGNKRKRIARQKDLVAGIQCASRLQVYSEASERVRLLKKRKKYSIWRKYFKTLKNSTHTNNFT